MFVSWKKKKNSNTKIKTVLPSICHKRTMNCARHQNKHLAYKLLRSIKVPITESQRLKITN